MAVPERHQHGRDAGCIDPPGLRRKRALADERHPHDRAWQSEYRIWSQRDLSEKHYVYLWADGIYFSCRLSDDRPCLLVLMGETKDGRKELIAMLDGQRESEASWTQFFWT